MSLLREIQQSVIDDTQSLAPILLKLRLLAARLGSMPLEEWVKHESEGYPPDAELPDYRIVSVTYRGTFLGPFNSGVNNAPIAPYLIEKFANKDWVTKQIREGVAAIDDLLESTADGDGTLGIDASNLILLLDGKVYPDYRCNSVTGTISRSSMKDLQHAVRTRILELTIQLEKTLPGAADETLDVPNAIPAADNERVTQVFQQVIHGDVASIVGGPGATVNVSVTKLDKDSFADYLENSGITKTDASELAEIVAAESPEDNSNPFGKRAKDWIATNIKKALDGTWKVTVEVATKVLTEAAMKYYGLK